MLSFVVLVSRTGERLRAAEIERIAAEAVLRLPFEPSSHLHWVATGGQVALLAWDLHPDGYPPGPRWYADEQGVTAFGGYAFPVGGRWGPGSWARQLHERFRGGVLEPGVDQCWGIHTLARLKPDGSGFVTPDPLSMGLIFRSASAEFDAVSNRADLAATAAGSYHDRDPVGLGWLLVFEYLVDEHTSFKGVRALNPGLGVAIDGYGAVDEVRIDGDTWRGEPADYRDAYSVLADDLRDHMATIVDLDRMVEFSLSGGRDSRLVLALAVAAGVEKSFRYMTAESFPGELDPDVEAAEMIAREFGLDHRVLRLSHGGWSADDFERRVRVHAHTTTAMLGAKNLRARLRVRPRAMISGAFGENLTGPRSGDAPPETVDEAYEFMVGKMYGGTSGGFVRPEARAHYLDLLRAIFDELADDGTPAHELPYRFYVQYYLRGGVTREVEMPGIVPNIEPLYSVHLPVAARAAGWHGRRHHRLHLDLMLATAPRLAEIPFAAFFWPPELLATMPDSDRLRSEPIRYSGQLRSIRGRRWQDHVDVYRKYLLDPANPIGDLIDRAMVEEVLAGRQPLPNSGMLQLDNALGAAVWLAGDEEPARVTASEVERVSRAAPSA